MIFLQRQKSNTVHLSTPIMHYVSIHCDFVPDLSFLLHVLFSFLLYTFTLHCLFSPYWFFPCRARTQLLPKDSLICVPIVAQHIAWSPDKEMQRKACVSESRLHHHWNACPLNYLSHLATSVCMRAHMCLYQSIFFLLYKTALAKSISLCEKKNAYIYMCASVRMRKSVRPRERERDGWVYWRGQDLLLTQLPMVDIQSHSVSPVIYLLQVAQNAYQELCTGDNG